MGAADACENTTFNRWFAERHSGAQCAVDDDDVRGAEFLKDLKRLLVLEQEHLHFCRAQKVKVDQFGTELVRRDGTERRRDWLQQSTLMHLYRFGILN